VPQARPQPKGKTDPPGTGSRQICNGIHCASVNYYRAHPLKTAPVTTSDTDHTNSGQASCDSIRIAGQCISPPGGPGISGWLHKAGTGALGLLSGFTSAVGAGFGAAQAGLVTFGGWMSQAEYDALAGMGVAVACGESFTASTGVLLASGAAIPISALKPGDKVLATNVKTGKTQPETVAAVLVHHDTDLYNLTVKSGHRTTVIHTTTNHLFWDTTTHHWVKAAALHPGDHLRTPAGTVTTVGGGYTPRITTGWMWDLTIPTDHDFYIDTTVSTVLVHNDDCPSIGSRMRAAGPGDQYGLPNQGRIRYVPPEGYNPANPLPRGPHGGYIDRFGNEWMVGPSRTPGQPFEWDVQLSRTGRQQLGWLSRDASHVNVSPLGEVTH
jgi:hypothetical protein